jgi:hypothetical protein
VVKSPAELHSTDQAPGALAPHHALGSNLAVVAESLNRLVDDVDDVLVADVSDVYSIARVNAEGACAVLDKLVLATAAVADRPGAAA